MNKFNNSKKYNGKTTPILKKTFSSSNNHNNERLFKTINTPFKRRDPMRMIKTVDLVQMMKRKRRESNDKQKGHNFMRSPEEK